ncbi:MAG TPA: hypothetical protein VJC18_10345 [bacterium]|nr:hypothetical protein [bacterium]
MKIKDFFYADKIPFRIILFVTLVLCFYNLYHMRHAAVLVRISFLLTTVCAIALSLCAAIPWYGLQHKGLGIELHFYRLWVPTIYSFLVLNILFAFGIASVTLNFCLLIVYAAFLATNIVLLKLHFKDKDKTPPCHWAKHR